MALIDELKSTSPAFSTMSNLEIADFIHQTYAPTWNKEDVYNKLGVPLPTNPSGLLTWMPSGMESGVRNSQIGTNLLLNAAGLQGDEATANRVAELQRRQAELAPTGATKAGIEEIKKAGESGDIGDTLTAIATNPRALGRLLLESAGSFIPDLALAGVTGGVAGPAVKALAMRFGVKALAPEAIGLAAKMATQAGVVGAGSAKTEYGAEFLEALHDAGVDLTSSSSIKKAFQNEELMAKAREEGLAKGIPVGLFDGLSMGIAGRFYSKLAGSTIKSKLLGSAAEAGVQGGLGMAGEASGQLLQKGEISNVADVLLEGILEVATAGPEAAMNLRHNAAYQAQLDALNKATDAASEKAVDSQGNQLALPLQRYDTPAGQLSGPLVDKLIEKMAPKNAQVAEIAKSDVDVDTKRRMALEAIYGPDTQQAQINADTLESTTPSGAAQTGEMRRSAEEAKRAEETLANSNAEALANQPQQLPSSSIEANAQHSTKVAAGLREDLQKFEATLNELGPEALDTPIGAELYSLRSKVRDLDERTAAREYQYGFEGVEASESPNAPEQSSEVQPTNIGSMLAASDNAPMSGPSEVFPDSPLPTQVLSSIERFINSIDQGGRINIGALQGAVKADIGTTPTLSEIKETLASSPVITRNSDGTFSRSRGTYQSVAAPVRSSPETPNTRIPASRVEEDRLNLNPSPTPAGVDPINWFKASHTVQALPTGRALTPKMLKSAGIPEAQVPPIMKELIKNGALTKGAVPKRTITEVKMPNTLSDERATKLLNDEMTGKSYGC